MKQISLLRAVVLACLLSSHCSVSPLGLEILIAGGIKWAIPVVTTSLCIWSEMRHRLRDEQGEANARGIEANGKKLDEQGEEQLRQGIVQKQHGQMLEKNGKAIEEFRIDMDHRLDESGQRQTRIEGKTGQLMVTVDKVKEGQDKLQKGQLALGFMQARDQRKRDQQFRLLFTSHAGLYQRLQVVGNELSIFSSEQRENYETTNKRLENIETDVGRILSLLHNNKQTKQIDPERDSTSSRLSFLRVSKIAWQPVTPPLFPIYIQSNFSASSICLSSLEFGDIADSSSAVAAIEAQVD